MRLGALCNHDGRRRLWMQQASLSTFSVDWRGRVVGKERERRKHREQKSHRGSQQEGYSSHRALDGKYNTTAALSPPLSKLGKLLHRPSMPSASPQHFSAQQANTLACSPIPLQGQPATHSSTHHTQKRFIYSSSSWGSVGKDNHDALAKYWVDLKDTCADKGNWRHQTWVSPPLQCQ